MHKKGHWERVDTQKERGNTDLSEQICPLKFRLRCEKIMMGNTFWCSGNLRQVYILVCPSISTRHTPMEAIQHKRFLRSSAHSFKTTI